MLLSDIFDYLAHGELAQMAVANDGNGILATDYPRIVTNINAGLIELYKRFNIKMAIVNIQLYDQITTYYLKDDFAESNTGSSEPIKYIVDGTAAEAFSNNVLQITQIFDETNEEILLNDENVTNSIFTPTPTSLQVLDPSSERAIAVLYRAHPEKIAYVGLTDPTTVEVLLPQQFLEAMTAYVAYKYFATIPVGKDSAGSDNIYYAKFESACKLIEDLGLNHIDNLLDQKFGDNGWV